MAAKNTVTLTFAGDAAKLSKAKDDVVSGVKTIGDTVDKTSDKMVEGAAKASKLESGLGSISSVTVALSTAMDDATGAVSGLAQFMDRGRARSSASARALLDVEQASADAAQAMGDLRQAQLDLSQSMIDGRQAAADVEQAQLDQKQAVIDARTAQQDYNAAVKEHGKGSVEAQQALQDLAQAQQDAKQAGIDLTQAQQDQKQAQEDGRQATRDMTQAQVDAKGAALDLADAQHEVNPGTLAKWGQEIEAITPLIMGVVGATNLLTLATNALSISTIKNVAAQVAAKVATIAQSVATGVATAAQWLMNIALTANPIGLVIVAIAALIAIIVLIATKTTWFQTIWRMAWGGIKAAASAVWDWLKGLPDRIGNAFGRVGGLIRRAFSGLVDIITWPWRTAFNFIARAWNNTIGRLHWSIPGWVPGIGGNSISAPRLPTFHTGGIVPGAPGQEMLAVLQAGERVTPAGQSKQQPIVIEIRGDGTRLGQALVELLENAIRGRGGLLLGEAR